MGPITVKNKRKLGFNSKARLQKINKDSNTNDLQVTIEIPGVSADSYDGSNVLALPSRKRKKDERDEEVEPKIKKLTKRERKKLEKIKEVKEKKAKRAELFEALARLQASKEEAQLFTSISEVHTQRFKKRLAENRDEDNQPPNVIRGSNSTKVNLSDVEDEDEEEHRSEAESINTSDVSTDEEDSTVTGESVSPAVETKKISPTTCDNEVKTGTQNGTTQNNNRSNAANRDSFTVKELKCTKKAVHIPVMRTEAIQAVRKKLPIYGEEQQIMELINENDVTIVSGETGSGKTTQVPQFLYEAGYAHGGCIIGVTEPRRVAAISMAKRIAEELNLTSREVSYQIRYEGNVTPDTKIKFMTDGVLLREIEQDFMLTKYSVIILDEAHERSVFTDILIGLLSRIVPFRIKKNMKPLKLVIMSATLDKVQFLANPRLFRTKPAEVDVAARQFPVECHFARKTPEEYLSASFKKTCKIHQEQPPGGILVFVTGQQEVRTLVSKLRKTFPYDNNKVVVKPDHHESRKERKKKAEKAASVLPEVDLSKYPAAPMDTAGGDNTDLACIDTADIDDFDFDEGAETQIEDDTVEITSKEPMWVLPLYSLLSSEKQSRVFEPPPPGCRFCVVATNVAETSLTIPNIHYVVDTGKTKTKFYDKVTGVSTFRVTWTSKASANQRMGRAGRVGKGKCFRLYSSAIYNDNFVEHSAPEITRRPVEDLVLQMKAMAITKVANFPFPTPPATEQILAAEKLLLSLGAVQAKHGSGVKATNKTEPTLVVTELGRTMAQFPVAPRYARMLAATEQKDLLPYVIMAVAALSVDELFVDETNAEKEDENAQQKNQRVRALKRIWTNAGQSQLLGDLAMLIKAVGACETEGMSPQFCSKYGIRYKAMVEIRKLRCQLTKEVNLRLPEVNVCIDPKLAPPTEEQMLHLRKIITTGLADHVARLCPDPPPGVKDRHKNAYQCGELEDFVYIHPTSALYKQKKDFVVYQHVHQTSRQYMKGVVAIEPRWLPVLAPYHCRFSRPLEDPPPSWADDTGMVMCHMKVSFGSGGWELGDMLLEYPALPERVAWFAQFLLQGLVVPGLGQFTPHLLSVPSTVIKPWARLQPRTEVLKKALALRGVDCRQTLLDVWKSDPRFLLNAFLQWVPESMHWEVTNKWPPGK